jgi:glucokinase
MNKAQDFYIGVDIGGTKTAMGISSRDGCILARSEIRTSKEPHIVLSWVTDNYLQWKNLYLHEQGSEIKGIGIGCPGPLDRTNGTILNAPNLEEWYGYPIVKHLEESCFCPVYLENDANVAALGEFRYGAGMGYQNLVYLTISTGIGGGIIINGKLYIGTDGCAGEFGHMTIEPDGPSCKCGNNGCLEALASGTAIMREANEYLKAGQPTLLRELFGDTVTSEQVAHGAKMGDHIANIVIQRAMRYLGIGIANIMTELCPQVIILGGGVTNIGDIMFSMVRHEVSKRVTMVNPGHIPILPAILGRDIGIKGAIAFLMDCQNTVLPHKE